MSMWAKNNDNFVYAPKIGASIVVTIANAIHRVESDVLDLCYKKQGQGSMGYYDAIPIENNKELLVNTWKLYFALRDADVEVNDSIEISHPQSGEYVITKLG